MSDDVCTMRRSLYHPEAPYGLAKLQICSNELRYLPCRQGRYHVSAPHYPKVYERQKTKERPPKSNHRNL